MRRGCGQKPGLSKERKAGYVFRRRAEKSNRTPPQAGDIASFVQNADAPLNAKSFTKKYLDSGSA
jgi:hypothetical protein